MGGNGGFGAATRRSGLLNTGRGRGLLRQAESNRAKRGLARQAGTNLAGVARIRGRDRSAATQNLIRRASVKGSAKR